MPDAEWDAALSWLRQQLDEDERIARAVADHRQRRGELRWSRTDSELRSGLIGNACGGVVTYDNGHPNQWQAAHIVRHDPAAILRRVVADRRLLDWAVETYELAVYANLWSYDEWQPPKIIALRYVDVPGFPEVLRLDQTETR